jgi:hypothetical protein
LLEEINKLKEEAAALYLFVLYHNLFFILLAFFILMIMWRLVYIILYILGKLDLNLD